MKKAVLLIAVMLLLLLCSCGADVGKEAETTRSTQTRQGRLKHELKFSIPKMLELAHPTRIP